MKRTRQEAKGARKRDRRKWWGSATDFVRRLPMRVNLGKVAAASSCETCYTLGTLRPTNRYFQKTSRRIAAAMKHRERTIRFAARSCGYSRLILRCTRRINKRQRLLFEAKFRIQQVSRLLHACFQ